MLMFCCPMPGATEFSDRATTDRDWNSGSTSGYKVQASLLRLLLCRLVLGSYRRFGKKSVTGINEVAVSLSLQIIWVGILETKRN